MFQPDREEVYMKSLKRPMMAMPRAGFKEIVGCVFTRVLTRGSLTSLKERYGALPHEY
jgi:hypothetical protein